LGVFWYSAIRGWEQQKHIRTHCMAGVPLKRAKNTCYQFGGDS
jgi:hypothetical protein